MTSVLVIDDHPIVRQGCRRMLEDAGVERIFEAADAAAGYKLYRRHCPDVAIVDLAIGDSGLGGLPLISRKRAPPDMCSRTLRSEEFLKAFATVRV